MMTESSEKDKAIRSVSEMTRRLGYNLAPGENKHSAYRVFEKEIEAVENSKSLIFVTETGMGSKHIDVGVSYGEKYRQFSLEKVVNGVALPSSHPEGYRNMDLESGGYNKIVAAIEALEKSGFFVDQSHNMQELKRMVQEQRVRDLEYVMSELVPKVNAVLPKFTEVENRYLNSGMVYLFPATKSREKAVSVVRIYVGKDKAEICRSRAKISEDENGPIVDKTTFEKRRDVGKYQYPYYVWEGKREEFDKGVEKLVWFMGETKF